MKKIFIIAIALILGVSAFGLEFTPGMIAADAEWVMHADFDRGRSTELGQFLMAEMDKGKCKVKLEKTKALFDMDPSRDIASVTAYGPSLGEEEGAMLIDATYDEARLMDFISQAESYKETTLDGYKVHSWTHAECNGTRRTHAIFTADGVIVCSGTREGVIAAADVLVGKKPSIRPASTINLANQGHAPFMAAALKVDDARKIPAKAAILKQSESMVFTAKERAGKIVMRMNLKTDNAETALNVDSIARGMLAMMHLQSQENPDLATIAQGVEITTVGNEVSIKIAIPFNTLIDMYYGRKINMI